MIGRVPDRLLGLVVSARGRSLDSGENGTEYLDGQFLDLLETFNRRL